MEGVGTHMGPLWRMATGSSRLRAYASGTTPSLLATALGDLVVA